MKVNHHRAYFIVVLEYILYTASSIAGKKDIENIIEITL